MPIFEWGYKMTTRFFLLLLICLGFGIQSNAQNAVCISAAKLCSADTLVFPALTGNPNSQKYGCCTTTPNRSWYYFEPTTPGDLHVNLYSTPARDIDFVCWGPYDSLQQGCTNLDSAHIVDCSYLSTGNEMCDIPAVVTGKFYILLVCNFSNQACSITVVKTGGTSNMNCLLPPTISNSGPVCKGDTVFLQAATVSGANYQWTGPGGFSSNPQNPVNPGINQNKAGTYSLIVSQGVNLAGPVNTQVTVWPDPVPGIISDTAICFGASLNPGASALPGNTYVWTSSPPGFTSVLSNPNISPTVETKYFLEQTSAHGCKAKDSVLVSLNPLPLACVSTIDSVCTGANASLGCTAVTGNAYAWTSLPAGFTSYQANPQITASATQTFYLQETNLLTGCKKTNSFQLVVVAPPVANAGPAQSVCAGSSVQIGMSGSPGLGYLWSSQPAGFTSPSPNPTVSPAQSTTYTLIVTNSTGCQASGQVIVTVKPAPAAFTGSAQTVCSGNPVNIGTTPVMGNTYLWTASPGVFYSTVSNPLIFPTQTATYTLTETNTSTQCTAVKSVLITVKPLPIVGFSPFPQPFCHDASPFPLTGGTPAGGTYNGLGVSQGQFNPGAVSAGTYSINYQYTNSGGCTGYAFQSLVVQNKPWVHGNISYDNVQSTPLDSCKVYLMLPGGTMEDSVVTGSAGTFNFQCIQGSSIDIFLQCAKNWGGVNSHDALLVAQYFVGMQTFSPLRLQAADVSADGMVNATDALLIMKRFVNFISEFPAGNWVLDQSFNIPAQLPGINLNQKALCVGDVNGSFTPQSTK